MKKPMTLLLAMAVAFSAHAASLGFVKAGSTYKVSFFAGSALLEVISDEGGGWYRCLNPKDNEKSFVNFNQAVEIVPQDDTEVAPQQTVATGLTPDALRRAVLNNLRQLTAAADQYFLETGKSEVRASELIGPKQYVKEIKSLDGEDYHSLVFKLGQAISIRTRSGVTVSYNP